MQLVCRAQPRTAQLRCRKEHEHERRRSGLPSPALETQLASSRCLSLVSVPRKRASFPASARISPFERRRLSASPRAPAAGRQCQSRPVSTHPWPAESPVTLHLAPRSRLKVRHSGNLHDGRPAVSAVRSCRDPFRRRALESQGCFMTCIRKARKDPEWLRLAAAPAHIQSRGLQRRLFAEGILYHAVKQLSAGRETLFS